MAEGGHTDWRDQSQLYQSLAGDRAGKLLRRSDLSSLHDHHTELQDVGWGRGQGRLFLSLENPEKLVLRRHNFSSATGAMESQTESKVWRKDVMYHCGIRRGSQCLLCPRLTLSPRQVAFSILLAHIVSASPFSIATLSHHKHT